MKLGMTLLAGALGTTLLAGSALAADISPIVPPAPAPAPVFVPPSPTINWAGPYIGGYGGLIPTTPDSIWEAGAQGGYNFVRGRFLFGIEAQAGAVFGGAGGLAFDGAVNGRAGILLGDRVLAYGEAGVGIIPAGPGGYWTAGGGVEVALNPSWSIFGEGKVITPFGTSDHAAQIQFGINWHPNY